MSRADPSVLFALLLGLASGASGAELALTVSPGAVEQLVEVDHACPFFSWQEVGGALGYELLVYRLLDPAGKGTPVLRQSFEGAVDGWTPPLDRCLEPGERYAWSVRAVFLDRVPDWSRPRLFRVAEPPAELDLQGAIEVVRSYLQARWRRPLSSPSVSQIETVVRLASEVTAPDQSPVSRGVAAAELTVDGGFQATSFTGDGSTLTGLQPGSIASGTAGFSVTGSSGDVSCTGCITSSHFGPGQVKAADIGNAQVGGSHIDPSTVQARITGACADDQVIQAVGSDGSVTCTDNTQILLGIEYFVDHFNGGVSSVSVSSANRLCFLSYVRVRDTDEGDTAACKIELVSGSWVLFAVTEGDADASCRMRCIVTPP